MRRLQEDSIQVVERRSWLSIFHLALRGRFSSDEVIGAVQYWLKTEPENFFSDGIKNL